MGGAASQKNVLRRTQLLNQVEARDIFGAFYQLTYRESAHENLMKAEPRRRFSVYIGEKG